MMCLVVLLLLVQLANALQFGALFRRKELNSAVRYSNDSEISIRTEVYNALLYLESNVLVVESIAGMQVCRISAKSRIRSYLLTAGEVEVQLGDVLMIYETGTVNQFKYKDATAENLESKIENAPPRAKVFGAVIQANSAPNYGFTKLFLNDKNTRIELLQSTVEVSSEAGYTATLDRISGKELMATSSGKTGFLARIRGNDYMVTILNPPGYVHSMEFEKGDRIILMAAGIDDWMVEMNMMIHRMARELAEGDISALNSQEYSNLAFFVAEIGDTANYLEEIAIVGRGKVENGSFKACSGTSFWRFEGDTMIVKNNKSAVLHISKNEEAKDVDTGNVFKLTTGRVEFSNVQPGDIVVIIRQFAGTVESVDIPTLKKALSGCKNSSELRIALKGLGLSRNTSVMAAFVSDSVRFSKPSVAEPKVTVDDSQSSNSQSDDEQRCILC
ncbi:hypothetical protein PSACC_01542 [Paramicrosporidium saccamoebae]|uniref:Uncharacterized protein n=1 Tax=Paramicrosporidium saccamoebae TaxID=1246581 RepID=A0A2H9TLL0_9FUNG|nr:hypothetical protein PSACC_01542 [Paramicrosporidium saccamoebae]